MSINKIIIKLLACFGISTLIGGCAPLFLPVDVAIPLDLSKAGNTAETEFKIFLEDQYELKLEFFSLTNWAPTDRDLLKFLGDRENNPGAIIPLKLLVVRLSDEGEKVIIDKEYFTKGVEGVGEKSIIRNLTILRLEAGNYKIRIENKKDFPELVDIRVLSHIFYFRR